MKVESYTAVSEQSGMLDQASLLYFHSQDGFLGLIWSQTHAYLFLFVRIIKGGYNSGIKASNF